MVRGSTTERLFYQGIRIASVVSQGTACSVFRSPAMPLIEMSNAGDQRSRMLAIDDQKSVVRVQLPIGIVQHYTPYGHAHAHDSRLLILGYNGQRLDPLTRSYPLGLGHRLYAAHMMRFLSPDAESPFNEGGLNAYAYCLADPMNREDDTGQSSLPIRVLKGIGNLSGLRKRGKQRREVASNSQADIKINGYSKQTPDTQTSGSPAPKNGSADIIESTLRGQLSGAQPPDIHGLETSRKDALNRFKRAENEMLIAKFAAEHPKASKKATERDIRSYRQKRDERNNAKAELSKIENNIKIIRLNLKDSETAISY